VDGAGHVLRLGREGHRLLIEAEEALEVHQVGRGRAGEPARLGEDRRDHDAGLDDDHADPEGQHFLGERLAGRLQHVLRGAVVAVTGHRHHASDGAHVHDRAVPALPHPGEHGLDHPDRAEVVGLEERRHPLHRGFLDRPAATDARVVDEDVHATGAPEHFADAALDGGGVVHVEGDGPDRPALPLDRVRQVTRGGGVAEAGVDLVPLAPEVEGGGVPVTRTTGMTRASCALMTHQRGSTLRPRVVLQSTRTLAMGTV
jgi:hypothetical protein